MGIKARILYVCSDCSHLHCTADFVQLKHLLILNFCTSPQMLQTDVPFFFFFAATQGGGLKLRVVTYTTMAGYASPNLGLVGASCECHTIFGMPSIAKYVHAWYPVHRSEHYKLPQNCTRNTSYRRVIRLGTNKQSTWQIITDFRKGISKFTIRGMNETKQQPSMHWVELNGSNYAGLTLTITNPYQQAAHLLNDWRSAIKHEDRV